MPFKDVLLPIFGQPRRPTLAAIDKCVAVAAGFGARITALALEEDVLERPEMVFPAYPDAAEETTRASDLQQLLNAFNEAVSRADVRVRLRSGKVPADHMASTLAQYARCSDLTLVPVRPDDSGTENIIDTLLFGSGRPVLLCPEHRVAELRPDFEKVMIAWDHSACAARAIGDALPILQAAAVVRVVTVTDDATGTVQRSGMDLVDHLREHGIHASFEATKESGSSVGKVLGTWAQSNDIDAIVMGAYHHSRLNEVIWGGVTKTVIGQPPCWTIMSH
jgi:nucleotide-binding universal stress UspA family protein